MFIVVLNQLQKNIVYYKTMGNILGGEKEPPFGPGEFSKRNEYVRGSDSDPGISSRDGFPNSTTKKGGRKTSKKPKQSNAQSKPKTKK